MALSPHAFVWPPAGTAINQIFHVKPGQKQASIVHQIEVFDRSELKSN
jgi:hypothetical protein